MENKQVKSVEDFIAAVKHDTGHWSMPRVFKSWFRGQADSTKPPTPSVLRSTQARRHEVELASLFRLRAQAFGLTPETGRLDQWLILMQHHGFPTRLLDWTESPLAGLFFAVSEFVGKKLAEISSVPAVWVLNPFELNKTSVELSDELVDLNELREKVKKKLLKQLKKEFPNTWTQSPPLEDFKIAFGTAGQDLQHYPEKDKYLRFKPTKYPLAIQPSFIHARVYLQKSCFTIHGTDDSDFEVIGKKTKLINNGFLLKYRVPKRKVRAIVHGLFDRGVTFSSLFPDLDNLAKDLKYQFVSPKP